MTVLKNLDLFFWENGQNHLFARLFRFNLMVAFELWGLSNVRITNLLEQNKQEQLKEEIIKLVDKTAKFDSTMDGIAWRRIITSEESQTMANSVNRYAKDERLLGGWQNINVKYMEMVKLKENSNSNDYLYYIGEIFMNIDRIWTLMHQSEAEQNPTYYKSELYSRIAFLTEVTKIAAAHCCAIRKGDKGRKTQATKRDRCLEMLQEPKNYFGKPDRHYNSIKNSAARLKQLYLEQYGEELQTKGKNGKITPCERVIEGWISKYTMARQTA